MHIVISTWTDEVDAEGEEFSSLNQESYIYDLDEVDSACHDFEIMLKNMSYDEELRVGQVVYGVDADTDYDNGNSAFERIIIDVVGNDTLRNTTEKRIRKQIQEFLDTI